MNRDRYDRIRELASRITRQDAALLNPVIDAGSPSITLGHVMGVVDEAGYSLWEALDPDSSRVDSLRDLLLQHRHALWACGAALAFEIARMEIADKPEVKA